MSLIEHLSESHWEPAPPPKRGAQPSREFLISMLMPGFASGYHQAVLGRSHTTIRRYHARAQAVEAELKQAINDAMTALTPADGMKMARIRKGAQLPFWSRLAIVEYRKRGYTIPEIAKAFKCSMRTVSYVVKREVFTSPQRRLTRTQKNPPAKKQKISEIKITPSSYIHSI